MLPITVREDVQLFGGLEVTAVAGFGLAVLA